MRRVFRDLQYQTASSTKHWKWGFAPLVVVFAAAVLLLAPGSVAANPSANLDQCANGSLASPNVPACAPTEWVNGNLGASKAHYFEGDSIPYRMVMNNLNTSITHHLTIEWDTTKSGKHAIDYLTSYDRTVGTANPCAGVSSCGAPTTFPIPTDTNAVNQIAGNLTIFGGSITSIDPGYSVSGSYTGDSSTKFTINFTTTVSNPVIAWGGHIATRADWGNANSAVAISGSPYHMRLKDLDGSGGNQDRSLSADAVIFPGSITIIKDAVPNDAKDFAFTTTGGLTPSTFSLDDDSNGTLSNTQAYSGILNFTNYTFVEGAATGWVLSFNSPVCTVTSGNGGTQTGNVGTRTLSIGLKEGENVTCTFVNTHTLNSPSIATVLSDASVTVGDSVSDSSSLTGATSDAGGSVTYTVYSDSACTTGARDAGTKTVTNGVVPDSNSLAFNTAGTFYWQASYTGDSNNNSALSTCTDETLVVGLASPSIATVLSDASVTVGDSVSDSSSLTGATSDAGGSVTYTVYSDSACTTGARDAGTKTVTNGVVPDSNSLAFNTAGTFYWQASYTGDSNNNSALSTCTDETLVVGLASPSIATVLSATSISVGGSVSDSSSLTGATSDAGGSVTYTVYSDSACTTGARDAGTKTVTNGVVPDSNSLAFNTAGTFYWQASYTGDSNNNSALSTCTDETLVVGLASPSIATVLSATSISVGGSVSDSSSLTGATSDAGGSVTYTVYSDSACTTGARDAGTKTVTNGVVPDSNSLAFNTAGTFYWQASYTGDSNNNSALSTCTDETLVVGLASPSIATVLSATSISVGGSVSDSSSLTGATSDAGGSVTYTVYSDSACTTGARDAGTKTVTNGVVPDSNSLAFNTAGTFYWQASYTGDSNNNSALSTCTDETLVVGLASPSIATVLSATSISVGGSVSDSSSLTGATSDAGGSVTYTVYSDSACTTGARDAGTKTVTNGVVPDSNSLAFNTAGTFYWQASYTGDSNNNSALSTCTDETLVVNAPTVISQITPTATTCQLFSSGTSATLSQLQYSLKGSPPGVINQVNPGVFFYWIKVTGGGTYNITQTITTAGTNVTQKFNFASGSNVFNASCAAVSSTITQSSNGTVTVTFSGSGTFYIGIKYDASSVKNIPAPNPTTTHYEFATSGVSGSTQGLDLVKK